ncbi:MAG: InlB B-repeat-containing protein [Clostridiales bacterium]|nr:InlB B-repeat-containing protein [Clostridiales bacterium]
MKRNNYRIIFKKSIAIVLVASMSVSLFMTYDKAGQFFNSIKTVFADEVEDAEASSAESEAPVSETTAAPVETTYEEDTAEDKNETGVSEETNETEVTEGDKTEPSESDITEPTETESKTEETEPVETEPSKTDIELTERKIKAEGADIYVTGLLPADVKVTAERVEVEVSGAKVIAAYDIKVFDKDGNEWQPSEPLKIEVVSNECNSVTKNETEVIYVPDELAESGKPVDIKNKKIEKIDAEVKDGKVEFEAGHFSVYVIIEHEGGEVVTPRVMFHFIAPVGENYQPTLNGDVYYYTASPYEFNNKAIDTAAGHKQVSMIVRDGDKLESIEAPMNTQNTYFYGWYVVNKSSDNVTYNTTNKTYSGSITYSWPLDDPGRVELDKAVTISAVKSGSTITSINWTVGNASGTSTDVDSEGCAHVYLAPIYSNYYFVNFHLGARSETTAETLLARKLIVLGNSNHTDVKISDIEAPSNDPIHVVFIGWEENTGTAQNPNWTLIRTIDANNNTIIDPGKDGKYITVGAQTVDLYPFFVQARYIKFNIGASGNGALFLGPQLIFTSDNAVSDEYALSSLPTTTRNGYIFDGWYTGADGTGHQITDAQGNVINNDYVYGNPKEYEVKNGKLYAYEALDELEFHAKWVPNITTKYKVIIWRQKVSDAVNASTKTYEYYTHFVRDFDYQANGNSFIVSTTDADRSYVTTNPGGMFTGFHLGSYDAATEVDPQGGTVLNVYYDRNTYTFTFQDHYQATTSNNGTQYGVVNNKYQQIYYRSGSWRLTNNNNGTVYTGTRYTKSNNNWYTTKTITALSGHDISSYFPIVADSGVVYDNGDRWMPTNSTVYDQVVVIINKIPNENITFQWNDPENRPQKTINYYVEVLPGETPALTVNNVDYKLRTSITARVNFFTREDYVELDGFTQSGSNPAFASNGRIENVDTVNFYYTRDRNKLIFSANYPDAYKINEPEAQEISNVPYEQNLASYSNTAAPVAPGSDYIFAGWYEDASGQVPFDFANETMPADNKIIYANWTLVEFPININPNGGEIDSINYSWFTPEQLATVGLSGANNGYATYFDNLATQTIEQYANLERKFVEVSDAEAAQMDPDSVYRYVYVYKSNQEGGEGKTTSQGRCAVYIKDTVQSLNIFYEYYVHEITERQRRDPDLQPLPQAQWEATYVSKEKYRELRPGEKYVFLAWYEVVNGVRQSTPFDFTQPAEHETTLIAEWRLDGGYSLLYTTEYYSDNHDYITANLDDWTDPLDGTSKYADGATTQAMQEPTSVTVNGKSSEDAGYIDYQFLGWQIVKVEYVAGMPRYTPLEPGVYYTAGQDLTVRARYSDENMVIHMQAVYQRRDEAYRRPEVVNLTLNASKDAMNAGTGSVNSSIGTLPEWRWPGHYWSDGTCIYFGDTQSNTAVKLYKYATTLTESEITGEALNPAGVNVFTHSKGFKLIGFDLDSPDTDFVPDYPADGVIAVSPKSAHTLYAVWEPMVYLTIKNETGVGPVTFTISGTDHGIQIVNQTDGSFSREKVNTNQSITLAAGESIRLVIPYGEYEQITLSGTNTLGTGYWLDAESALGYTNPTERTLSGTYYRVPNTENFNFTDPGLVNDAEGVVITFKAEKAPHTLVLDDNYEGGATREITFGETNVGVVFYQNDQTTSYTLPSTSTRIGWELLGWDENASATTPTYTTGAWTITDLTSFYTSNGSSTADIEVKTLYAIWKANADASTVYVWKNVPEPGDQDKEFTFSVSLGGRYTYQTSEWSLTGYRWKSQPSTGNISQNTANGTAVLTSDFTLKHNQYLMIITEKNETNQNNNRPFITMKVSKWQVNIDGTKTQVGNETVLSWYWSNRITVNPSTYNQYGNFSFQNLNLSVTEADYTAQYDLGIEVAAHTTNAVLNTNETARQLTWTDTFAGGTVIFTNTRKTADVTIKKTLLPETVDPENFEFNVTLENGESYTLDPATKNILSGADAENGGEWKIEGIPTGATLIITETVDSNRYITSAEGVKNADNAQVTDIATEDNIFSFVVEDNTTVTFTNELRTQKIRLVVVDDDEPAQYLDSANFTFPGVFEGTKFSAANTGLVWEGTVFVGEYTLTETSMPDHAGVRYTKLQASVDVIVNGGTGGDKVLATTNAEADTVSVTYDANADTYTITVVNPKMLRVTVKKTVESDYGNNSFLFTVKLTDSEGAAIQRTDVYGTQGTDANGELEFTLVNNQTALLYVPRNTNVQITETTGNRYKTTYKIGPDADHLGDAVEGAVASISEIKADKYVHFTNERLKAFVTVTKVVEGNGGTFTFTIQLKENNAVVPNYTLSNNNTPDDTSDDIVTDSDGIATFTLSPAADGTDSKVFTIHSGMSVSVTEAEDTTRKYTTRYEVRKGDMIMLSSQSYSTGFVTADDDMTITYTNTEASLVAPTNVKDDSMTVLIAMISSAVCFAGAVVQIERKKRERGQEISTNDE